MSRIIYFFSFLFCVALLCLAGCGGQSSVRQHNPMGLSGKINPEAETAFSKARVLWRNSEICSDPPLAIQYLDTAIRLQPDYAEAYLRRGLAKSDQRDWDAAFDDVSAAIRLAPTADAYAYRGLISMRGGNSLGARKDFDRSLQLNSSQHRAWNFRAALDLLENNPEGACSDFAKGCGNGDCVGLESARANGICK